MTGLELLLVSLICGTIGSIPAAVYAVLSWRNRKRRQKAHEERMAAREREHDEWMEARRRASAARDVRFALETDELIRRLKEGS